MMISVVVATARRGHRHITIARRKIEHPKFERLRGVRSRLAELPDEPSRGCPRPAPHLLFFLLFAVPHQE